MFVAVALVATGLTGTCAEAQVAPVRSPRKVRDVKPGEPVRINGEVTTFRITATVPFRLPEKLKSRAGRPDNRAATASVAHG